VMEFSLKLDSNPEFTASVLVACARAVVRMNGREIFGCKTLFDVPPADLAFMDADVMRKKLL
ncbi:MAG: diaminopimelate dehydrogenase, partial [Clostridia bacterium]|nr:diaminopimelate dehydrogenase [Clostridia bacterium]MBQ9400820.1 diaminopimelate dehydrogenase [Clostridia bacterium]